MACGATLVMCLALHSCVRVPRVLSDTAETHRTVAPVHGVHVFCTGCGAVRESSHTFRVLLCVFCGWGAAKDPRRSTVAS